MSNLLHSNIDVHRIQLIAEFPGYGVNFIPKLQSHYANMNFSDKSRYDRLLQTFKHKGGKSAIKYMKIFQYSQALSVLVRKSYSEDQFMHIFLDNFHQGEKYTAQIASHQAELRREGNFTDLKSLSIAYL